MSGAWDYFTDFRRDQRLNQWPVCTAVAPMNQIPSTCKRWDVLWGMHRQCPRRVHPIS